jgi:uncharacterized membrane protein
MHLTTYSSTTSNHLDILALTTHVSLLSYTLTIFGLLSALPTLLTGLAEGYATISANGLDLSKPKVRIVALHAASNDLALAGAFANYWARSSKEGFFPQPWNVAMSVAILGLVVYSAYLGGSLVYKFGMGVQRQGAAKHVGDKEKEKMVAEGQKKERKAGKKEL